MKEIARKPELRPNPNPISLESMHKLEDQMLAEWPVIFGDDTAKHYFCKDMYGRECLLPKGTLTVSRMHKKEFFLILLSGEVTITTPEGNVHVKAPWMTMTVPGTKRVLYAHEDSIFIAFFPNPDNINDPVEMESILAVDWTHEAEAEFLRTLEDK